MRVNRVVVAPDSFKGSVDARTAARAIAEGWSRVRPGDELIVAPQADGGEGTLDAVESAVPDSRRRSAGTVTGPDGAPVPGEWLELPGGIAIVELATSSGLPLMRSLDALGASTRGVGEIIGAALDAGATRIIVGLGGSASTDGGAGALRALGLATTDANGRPLAEGGGALAGLAAIDRSGLRAIPGGVVVLTDVVAPLLGPTGAAAVFGPQKGASARDVTELEIAMKVWASLLRGDPSAPGAGAAGGTAFGFLAAYGATIRAGADYVRSITGVDEEIAGADVILTGEGSFDHQSLGGKVVGSLLAATAASSARRAIIAGRIEHVDGNFALDGVERISLSELAGSAEASLADPVRFLGRAGELAATTLG